MSNFEVGDRVCCLRRGEGEVTNLIEDDVHPVAVSFVNGSKGIFMQDGRLYESDLNPSLYKGVPVIAVKPFTPRFDHSKAFEWLKEKGLYELFVKRHQEGGRSSSSLDSVRPKNLIDQPFEWSGTREGLEYWLDVHHEYIEWLKKQRD